MRTLMILLLLVELSGASAQRLVMRGDHADPSVVKIGDTYWASATTSNWFPAYPLMSSKDLVNWTPKGYVFTKMPAWTDFYFWAPEITYEKGKVYLYYAAHKKNGNLCISVASADNPAGPYKDHGPLICEEAGSIDAFPMRDENGKLFIIWKEDGNSVSKPTPIWAQQINEERTAVIGEKKELFRNSLEWEGNLVEGVSMMKIGEYYYAFYAAAACCGIGCSYQSGVARSKKLLGPWEKYNKNPILANAGDWKCPGHGTPIAKDGKYYFLYHAYNKETNIFTGRQGLLQEFKVTADKWIEFVNTSKQPDVKLTSVTDEFDGTKLKDYWQWSVFQSPVLANKGGSLTLRADNKYPSGAYIGTKIFTANYTASVTLNATTTNAAGGIGAIGDDQNTISLLYFDSTLRIYQQREGKETELGRYQIPASRIIYLNISAKDSRFFNFSYSLDGKNFTSLNKQPIDGTFLPPWDRAIRIGLISKGKTSEKAVFESFRLQNFEPSQHSAIAGKQGD
jgi:xylan 1,4-beta-xylosidase